MGRGRCHRERPGACGAGPAGCPPALAGPGRAAPSACRLPCIPGISHRHWHCHPGLHWVWPVWLSAVQEPRVLEPGLSRASVWAALGQNEGQPCEGRGGPLGLGVGCLLQRHVTPASVSPHSCGSGPNIAELLGQCPVRLCAYVGTHGPWSHPSCQCRRLCQELGGQVPGDGHAQ